MSGMGQGRLPDVTNLDVPRLDWGSASQLSPALHYTHHNERPGGPVPYHPSSIIIEGPERPSDVDRMSTFDPEIPNGDLSSPAAMVGYRKGKKRQDRARRQNNRAEIGTVLGNHSLEQTNRFRPYPRVEDRTYSQVDLQRLGEPGTYDQITQPFDYVTGPPTDYTPFRSEPPQWYPTSSNQAGWTTGYPPQTTQVIAAGAFDVETRANEYVPPPNPAVTNARVFNAGGGVETATGRGAVTNPGGSHVGAAASHIPGATKTVGKAEALKNFQDQFQDHTKEELRIISMFVRWDETNELGYKYVAQAAKLCQDPWESRSSFIKFHIKNKNRQFFCAEELARFCLAHDGELPGTLVQTYGGHLALYAAKKASQDIINDFLATPENDPVKGKGLLLEQRALDVAQARIIAFCEEGKQNTNFSTSWVAYAGLDPGARSPSPPETTFVENPSIYTQPYPNYFPPPHPPPGFEPEHFYAPPHNHMSSATDDDGSAGMLQAGPVAPWFTQQQVTVPEFTMTGSGMHAGGPPYRSSSPHPGY